MLPSAGIALERLLIKRPGLFHTAAVLAVGIL